MVYEVQTCVGNSWGNVWLLDDKPHTFPTEKAAQAEIADFLADIAQEIACGDRDTDAGYTTLDFNVARVQ